VNDTSKPAEPAFQQEDRSRPRRARCRQYPRVLLALAALLSLFVVNVGAQNPADRGGSTNPGNPAAGAQGQPAQGQPAQGQPAQGQPGAAGQGNQDPIRIEGDFVVFSVDENQGVPFKEFIKFAQIVTKKTFVVDWENDPAAGQDTPNSRINLLGALRIRKENFYDFFQTMMYIKGWACVPRGTGSQQFIHIIYQQGAKNAEIKKGVRFVPVDDIDRYRDQTGTFIITTVTMEHINAQLASQTLRTVFSAGGTMEQALSFGNSKKLLLTGFGPSVYTQVQLLKLVDIEEPRAEANFRLIPLQYSSVEEIEPIITELMNERAKTPPAAGGAQNIQRPEDIVPVVVRQFAQDNALIVYAHESRIREIETMVAKLDSKANSIEGNYHVYPLKHTLAKETREVVHNFLDAANNAQQRAGAGQGGAAGGAANREPRPVVIADEKSNRLLISASKTEYQRISDLVAKVDVRQPQVLIEAALIELATQDVERLGIELGLLDLGGDDFTRPFAFTNFGNTVFEDTDGNGLPDTRLPDFDNPPSGLVGGIISSSDFAIPVVLNALKGDQTANVLSVPSILVNNNGDAIVSSKDAFPTTRSQAGNVTTQTDFSGFQEAGIDLKISPSISEGNYLKLNIDLEVSKFTGTFDSTSSVPPPKTVRKVTTSVTMPSGHTMVLGGVIEDQSSETSDGIPILKDIPLLGVLFRNTEKTQRKTNLYFFLTPYILDDPDFADLAELTLQRKLDASKYIGDERLKIIDRKWQGKSSYSLEDSESILDDIERLGGFDIPSYGQGAAQDAPTGAGAPTGPQSGPVPGEQPKTPEQPAKSGTEENK
jgi:general secretion pathway protein D